MWRGYFDNIWIPGITFPLNKKLPECNPRWRLHAMGNWREKATTFCMQDLPVETELHAMESIKRLCLVLLCGIDSLPSIKPSRLLNHISHCTRSHSGGGEGGVRPWPQATTPGLPALSPYGDYLASYSCPQWLQPISKEKSVLFHFPNKSSSKLAAVIGIF